MYTKRTAREESGLEFRSTPYLPPAKSLLLLRPNLTNGPTLRTRPRALIFFKVLHRLLNLGSQIRAVKTLLMNLLSAIPAVPAQSIHAIRRSRLLENNADCVGEADGIVRRVGRQEIHLAFVDVDVAEPDLRVDDFEEHAAFVLVEPFGGCVDVVVSAGVGAADNLEVYVS
jgi:hypothetical protein